MEIDGFIHETDCIVLAGCIVGEPLESLTDIDESRRRLLRYLLAAGAFALVPGCGSLPQVHQAMPMPEEMPAGMSIFQYVGAIEVNGKAATMKTRINPGDLVETRDGSQLVFVLQQDAFLLRANTRMRMPTKMTGGQYQLEQGKALSVFASRKTAIKTPSAVVAIRGTGVYVEVEPDLSYICTCYGETNIATVDDPAINVNVVSTHHNDPVYVLADKSKSRRILAAPFKDHSDQELLLVETLVGRTTPFVVPQGLRRLRGPYI